MPDQFKRREPSTASDSPQSSLCVPKGVRCKARAAKEWSHAGPVGLAESFALTVTGWVGVQSLTPVAAHQTASNRAKPGPVRPQSTTEQ